MQSLIDSPRPALRLCPVMQQERSTYRVQMSTLVSESSCAELIIGLRPDPCSMSAYQVCANRTFSTRTTSSIFLNSKKRTCHHFRPSLVQKLYNNEAAPKGLLCART